MKNATSQLGEAFVLCGTRIAVVVTTVLSLLTSALVLALVSAPAVASDCYALDAPRLTFSNYNPVMNLPEDISTTIDFYCLPAFKGRQLSLSVTIQDAAQGAAYTMKNMQGDVIRFGLFADPAYSIPLSAGMPIAVRDVNPDAKTFRVILYGRIFANQRQAGAGSYQSSLRLLLDY